MVKFLGLEVGSWADLLGAVGTIAAVFVAIYLPLKMNKPKAKGFLSNLYNVSEKKGASYLLGYEISFLNNGTSPINVVNMGIGLKGEKRMLNLTIEEPTYLIEPGIGLKASINAVGTYDALKEHFPDKKRIKIYPKMTDALGNIYKGKKVKIVLEKLEKDVRKQRELYEKSPELVRFDESNKFKTEKF